MLLFSEQHDWQNDPAVKQILVFPNQEVKDNFYKAFNAEVEEKGIENANDNNKGAVYKLRAVKDSEGKYIPVIRCGFTGTLIWENTTHYALPKSALKYCIGELMLQINDSFYNFEIK